MFYIWEKINRLFYLACFKLFSKEFISFGLVGLSGVLFQFLLFFLLDNFLNFNFTLNNLISILLGSLWGYYFNNLLTFKNKNLRGIYFIKVMIKFLIVSSITIFINIFASTVFFNFSNQKIFSILFGVLSGFFFNFCICRKLIWKDKKTTFFHNL